MSESGKQISVIIAGATGSTGRHLVSRLVSHPDVSRVVALARHPIPVNRWASVFPHLHTGDALRYLSVVPVDWTKVLADTSNVPSSYVSDGVWRQEDEAAERQRIVRRLSHQQAGQPAATGPWASVTRVEAPVGPRALGYVKYTPRSSVTAGHPSAPAGLGNGSAAAAAAGGGGGGGGSWGYHGRPELHPHPSASEAVQDSQAFLQQLLHNNFYTSVFAGHHVAINCLGTSHMLSSSRVTMVDYEISIAFAKMIRLFNCMAHAEPTEDEERLLVETTSRELGSVLWGEIYAACYGKPPGPLSLTPGAGAAAAGTTTTTTEPLSLADRIRREAGHDVDGRGSAAGDAFDFERMNRGGVATLRHFSQISVRGASDRSPLSYLRAHGRRDRDLLKMFNRHARLFASPGILQSMFFSEPATHVTTRSEDAAAAGAGHDAPVEHPVDSPGHVRFRLSPMKAATKSHAPVGDSKHTPAADDKSSRPFLATVRRILRGPPERGGAAPDPDAVHHHSYDTQQPQQHHKGSGATAAEEDSGPDSVARRRARLLLRRDVVKIWENANVTVWRPGVLSRPRPRWSERLFGLVERPVDVYYLAECVAEDIMDSVHVRSGYGHLGQVKVVNGKSVSRRAYVKAVEAARKKGEGTPARK